MVRQNIKRLGYGFSALVMSLSVAAFIPESNTYAEACTGTSATSMSSLQTAIAAGGTVCLKASVTVTSTITVSSNTTLDLGGYTLSVSGNRNIFSVSNGATLTISNGTVAATGNRSAFSGSGTVVVKSGTYTAGNSARIFSTMNTKANIEGGDFSGVTSSNRLGGSNNTVTVTGGTFGYNVAVANGYYAYPETGGKYAVFDKQNVHNTLSAPVTLPVDNQRTIGLYNSASGKTPTAAVTKGGATVTADTFEVILSNAYDASNNTIDVVAKAAGTYNVTVTGQDGTSMSNFTVIAYTVSTEEGSLQGATYDVKSTEELDLTDAYVTAVGSDVKIKSVNSDIIEVNADKHGLKVKSGSAAGKYDAVVTLDTSAVTAQTLTFRVNVFDTADAKAYAKVGGTTAVDYSASAWATVESADTAVATAELDTDGKVQLTGVGLGETTLTLKNADETISKTVEVGVYNLADAYAMSVNDAPIKYDDAAIVEVPEGWAVTATSNDASTTVADYASGYIIANGKGQKTFLYTITDADGDTAVDGAAMQLEVYGEAGQIPAQTVKVGSVLDMATLYVEKANENSTVVYSGDVTAEGESTVDTSTVGSKTVTVFEVLAGETIATQDVAVTVYGIELPTVEFFAGESASWGGAMEDTTIDNIATSSTLLGLTGEWGEHSFEVAADKAGAYTATYTVTYGDATTETLTQDVIAYNKLAITDEDLTIDLVEGSTDTDASFTVAGDGVISVSDVDGLAKSDDGAGKYTFTATAVGDYEVTIEQTVGGLTYSETRTISVVDSTVVEDYTELAWAYDNPFFMVWIESGTMISNNVYTVGEDAFVTAMTDSEHITASITTDTQTGTKYASIAVDGAVTPGVYELTLTAYKGEGGELINSITAPIYAISMSWEEKSILAGGTDEVTVAKGSSLTMAYYEYVDDNGVRHEIEYMINPETGALVAEAWYYDEEAGEYVEEEVVEYFTVTVSGTTATVTFNDNAPAGEASLYISTDNSLNQKRVYYTVLSGNDAASGTIVDAINELNAAVEAVNAGEMTEEEFDELLDAFKARFDSEATYLAVTDAIMMGDSVSTEIVTNPMNAEDVDDEVKAAITNKLGALGAAYLNNISYYDIEAVVKVNGNAVGNLVELSSEAEIVIAGIEGPATGFTRKFVVVRYHTNADGTVSVDVIEDVEFDPTTGELRFKSDKFSTYAVSYIDEISYTTKTTTSPNTGAATGEGASASATNMTMAVVAAIAAVTLAGAAVVAKRK